MTGVLLKRGNLDNDPWGECHVKMKTEIRVMLLQAKEGKDCSKPPEAEREAGGRCSLRASEGASPANTWILDSRPVRQIHFCCLSHSMALGYISCGNQTSYYDLF